jgi:Protein of unknown function (DUF3761)
VGSRRVWRAAVASAVAGAALFACGAGSAHPVVATCKTGYYENVSGHCVHRPAASPAGATARCRDGTYSYSEHASGTCSHHGGVARWLHHP